ncbi:hypothetical protein NHQ30_006428 [Ciborinia camelliae]|nr:hypothetical protein NHQ30_006428 [Ciborinia camelliae]
MFMSTVRESNIEGSRKGRERDIIIGKTNEVIVTGGDNVQVGKGSTGRESNIKGRERDIIVGKINEVIHSGGDNVQFGKESIFNRHNALEVGPERFRNM